MAIFLTGTIVATATLISNPNITFDIRKFAATMSDTPEVNAAAAANRMAKIVNGNNKLSQAEKQAAINAAARQVAAATLRQNVETALQNPTVKQDPAVARALTTDPTTGKTTGIVNNSSTVIDQVAQKIADTVAPTTNSSPIPSPTPTPLAVLQQICESNKGKWTTRADGSGICSGSGNAAPNPADYTSSNTNVLQEPSRTTITPIPTPAPTPFNSTATDCSGYFQGGKCYPPGAAVSGGYSVCSGKAPGSKYSTPYLSKSCPESSTPTTSVHTNVNPAPTQPPATTCGLDQQIYYSNGSHQYVIYTTDSKGNQIISKRCAQNEKCGGNTNTCVNAAVAAEHIVDNGNHPTCSSDGKSIVQTIVGITMKTANCSLGCAVDNASGLPYCHLPGDTTYNDLLPQQVASTPCSNGLVGDNSKCSSNSCSWRNAGISSGWYCDNYYYEPTKTEIISIASGSPCDNTVVGKIFASNSCGKCPIPFAVDQISGQPPTCK